MMPVDTQLQESSAPLLRCGPSRPSPLIGKISLAAVSLSNRCNLFPGLRESVKKRKKLKTKLEKKHLNEPQAHVGSEAAQLNWENDKNQFFFGIEFMR